MPKISQNSDVIVIGGGFAGLAAALRLHKAGAKIRIIEKRPFFGGRAYSFAEPKTGETVDNGQHLMMGAYHETFEFLKELGTFHHLFFQEKLEVSLAQDAQNFSTLRCPNLPAPLHLLVGLLRFDGLNFRDKRKMFRLTNFCKKTKNGQNNLDNLSVTDLFEKTGQTVQAVKKFWEPLGIATLNEPMHLASAELFIEVIRRGLLSKKSDSKLTFPRVGFSELYTEPTREYFEKNDVPISFQTIVTQIEKNSNQWSVQIQNGENFSSDQLLLAVPPNALEKILQTSGPDYEKSVPNLNRFKSAPIVSINLWYEDFDPPESFLGLIDSPIHWVFNKAKVYSQNRGKYISLVISGAYDLAAQNKEQLVQLATEELKRFYPQLTNKPLLHAQVIKEHEATYSGRTGLKVFRPQVKTDLEGLYLAGDWIDTGLPATIESAVASGHCAAKSIQENS